MANVSRARRGTAPPRRPVIPVPVAVAVAAAAAAAGVAWWVLAPRPAPPPPPESIGQRVPDEGYEHVAVTETPQYKAHPPASGPHYPIPAAGGFYPNGLQTGFWVHSLEHGYIVLTYKPPVSPEILAQFDRMVRDFPRSKYHNVKLVIVPYTEMDHSYAVLSWDWRLFMDTFDRSLVLKFYRAHVDHGREDLP